MLWTVFHYLLLFSSRTLPTKYISIYLPWFVLAAEVSEENILKLHTETLYPIHLVTSYGGCFPSIYAYILALYVNHKLIYT